MLKKILTISAIFVATFSTSFAGRFYIVPTIVYESVHTKNDITFEGVAPLLSLGYGDYFYPWLYVAIDVFGIYHPIDINNEPKAGVSIKTRWSLGGSLLFGYPLDIDLLIYLRAGIISTHFDKIDVTKSGYEIGLGFEVPLTCSWFLRAEYDFIRYNRIDDLGEPNTGLYALGAVYRFG